MSWTQMLAPERLANALGWTLVDSLWQGALIALVIALLWQPARRWSSDTRYGLCAAALLLLAILPAITLAVLLWPSGSPGAVYSASQPSLTTVPVPALGSIRASAGTWRESCEAALPWITAIWALGVLFLSVRRVGGWLWLMRMRQSWEESSEALLETLDNVAMRLGAGRLPLLKIAPGGFSPCVIGWLRPVIVLPAATLAGISTADLEALLAHELAHIRRHDYLANLLQTAVETLLFYHPAVWWVSRQMRIEREHCCDDMAVRVCGDRVRYARALVDLAGQSAASHFAIAASGGSLSARIKRLLAGDQPVGRPPVWPALLVAVGICALLVGGNRGVHAAGQSPAPPVKAEKPMPDPDKPSPFPVDKNIAQIQEQIAKVEKEVAETPDADEDNSGDDNSDWLGEMMHSGLRELSVDDLIQLRQHGVSPELAKETVRSLPNARPKDVIELADHGVDLEFIRSMRTSLGSNLGLKDVVRLSEHGVDPAFISAMRSYLGSDPSADELIKLRDHGVDSGFIRHLNKNGLTKLTGEQLIRMRDAGL